MAISACQPAVEYRFKPLPIPAERVDCVELDTTKRPKLAPIYKIDWPNVTSVDQAKGEVDRLLKSVYAREATVSRYILDIENVQFLCASDAEWLRDYAKSSEKQ